MAAFKKKKAAMKHEDGFHFEEYPCKSGQPDPLVIIMHGYGNHPDMFDSLPGGIHKEWPNADVLIVRGPVPLNATPEHKKRVGAPNVEDLYTWYKVNGKADKTLELALSHMFNRVPVVDELNEFADAQLKKRGLKDDGLVLYGFSLGGAMAVQMATKRKDKCAALVCHSAPVFPIIRPKSKPDTMMVMGDQDNYFYVTPKTIEEQPPKGRVVKAFDKALSKISVHYNASLKRLQRAGLPVESVVVKGLTHNINEESFDHTIKFIVKRLKK